ncbi:hypothetical protein F2Q69_00063238 [Brassica cretica]|uniref:Uncharacterized protein n=1 Tax=Brassica cretica TaxID=69181 RepID=A0A8S9RCS1_BRACR|nr:hypothetical protein F2Q69_00063238 [Brassica cretica]
MTWIRKNTPSVVTNVGQKITRDPRDTGSRYRFNKPERNESAERSSKHTLKHNETKDSGRKHSKIATRAATTASEEDRKRSEKIGSPGPPATTNMLRSTAVRSFIRFVEKFQSFEHIGKGGQENPAKQK